MSLRKRFAILVFLLLIGAGLIALIAPFAVSRGLSFYLNHVAREEGLNITLGRIDAPFLRPATIDDLRIEPAAQKPRAIRLRAPRVTLDFNFRGWLFSPRARLLRSLRVDRLRGSVRNAGSSAPLNWRALERMLPDDFRFEVDELEVATEATSTYFRDAVLQASEVEAGKFFAHNISVVSPVLRRVFIDLRGATAWEESRLTIAGISLARGLDLETLTVDLSGLTKRHLGLDFQLDTFGGNLRGSLQINDEKKDFAVDLAGSATNVSLAQLTSAVGLVEPLNGSLRAAKFTFRGTPGDFLDSTASVWLEAGAFSWRAHRADRVIFGATYYDRRLQVDQLFVQQQKNQLTVNGELLWPKTAFDWNRLPFHGAINATLGDADAFAQLFGARPGDFAGALSAQGEIDSLDPNAQGRLSLGGTKLTFRGVALDSLGAKFSLHGLELTVEDLELRHENDFLRAHGSVGLTTPHDYSGRVTGALDNLGEYVVALPKSWKAPGLGGGFTFDWSGDGNLARHSGTFQIFAGGLRTPIPLLRQPIDVTLEGTYSPEDIFFRTCRLASDRFSLGGFLMLGRNFIEWQAVDFILDGKSRASGTLFLPFSVDHFRKNGAFLESIDEAQKFDVDLTVAQLDLAKLVGALGENSLTTGVLDGRLAAYGPLNSLQLTTKWRLENLGPAPAWNTIEFGSSCGNRQVQAQMRATFGASAPISAQLSLPVRLEKDRLTNWSWMDESKTFSFSADCPALLVAQLPPVWRPLGLNAGILQGKIALAGSPGRPNISGDAFLLGGQASANISHPALSQINAAVEFSDRIATVSQLDFETDGLNLRWQGSLTTAPPKFAVTLQPAAGEIVFAAESPNDGAFSSWRATEETPSNNRPISHEPMHELVLRGRLGDPAFSLTNPSTPFPRTLVFDPLAENQLVLGVVRQGDFTLGKKIELTLPPASESQIPWP